MCPNVATTAWLPPQNVPAGAPAHAASRQAALPERCRALVLTCVPRVGSGVPSSLRPFSLSILSLRPNRRLPAPLRRPPPSLPAGTSPGTSAWSRRLRVSAGGWMATTRPSVPPAVLEQAMLLCTGAAAGLLGARGRGVATRNKPQISRSNASCSPLLALAAATLLPRATSPPQTSSPASASSPMRPPPPRRASSRCPSTASWSSARRTATATATPLRRSALLLQTRSLLPARASTHCLPARPPAIGPAPLFAVAAVAA